MPDILIRDLDRAILKKLKHRAAVNGRSLQSEIRMILEGSAHEMTHADLYKRAIEFSQKFKGRHFTDSVQLLREDRRR